MPDESVTLNVNVGGSGAADMQKLTEALEQAARAEAEYARQVKAAADAKSAWQKFEKDVDKEISGRSEPAHKMSRREQINAKATSAIESKKFNSDLQAEIAKRERTVGGMAAKGAGGLQSLMGGGGAMGLIGKAGPWGAAIAATMGALEGAAKKATEALNIMNSGVHTSAQKNEMLKEQFIPLYSAFKKLDEAIDGTTETLARNARRIEVQSKIIQETSSARSEYRSFEFGKYQGAEAMMRAASGRPGINAPRFDRSTATGQRASDEYGMVSGAQDNARKADLEARAAGFNVSTQKGIKQEADKRRDAALADFNEKMAHLRALRAEEERTGDRNKKGISNAATEAKIAKEKLDAANDQAKAETERHAETTAKWVEAEGAARRANLEVAKAELEVLKQKEQRMAAFAQKLGAMNEGDFEMAKAALEAVKESGIENVPQELADMAAQAAPEFIAKQREALGEKRAQDLGENFGGIDDSLIQDFRQNSLKEIREKVDKVAVDVRVQFDLDAEQTAELMVKQIAPILGEFGKALDIKISKLRDILEVDRTLKHAADG